MYKVYDFEEERFLDIRDEEKEICLLDSTCFFDKRSQKRFTTLSLRTQFSSLWSDFWDKKIKANKSLLKAVKQGNTKKI
jgi:hypothetical protein